MQLKRQYLLVLSLTCFVAAVTPAGSFAQTTHTPADWDAFQGLKINPGDTVQFEAETYKVDGQAELMDGVTYQGSPDGGTVIDGGGAFRAFTAWGDCSFTEGLNTTGPKGWVLKDLTFRNCVADKSNRECVAGSPPVVKNPGADDDGGALNIDNGAKGTVRNCIFNNNKTIADDGGAIAIDGAATVVDIESCVFEGNACETGADGGGAIVVEGSDLGEEIGAQVTFNGCTFKKNSSTGAGGVLRQNGPYSVVTFTGCIIDGNSTRVGSGGVCQAGSGATTNFVNCVIVNNKAGDNRILSLSRGKVINCTLAGNAPTDHKIIDFRQKYDGSIGLAAYTGQVINCLFINNRADGGVLDARDPIKFNAVSINNLFIGNVDSDGDRVANVTANVKEVNTVPVDSMAVTAVVAGAAEGDYRLVAGSPAIDAGTAEGAPGTDFAGMERPKGSGIDVGAYEFSQP